VGKYSGTKIIILYFWLQVKIFVRVYYDLDNFTAIRPVVTTGTFDGVHTGHRKVLERLKVIAREEKGESVVFTFYPHPRQILTPEEQNLRLINTLEEKIELLRATGIDHLIVYPFTPEFARLTYEEFVGEILVAKIGAACLVVGHDHRFGKNREGDYECLRQCADRYDFRIERLDALLVDQLNVSSSRIRQSLESGNIATANHYLGYIYELNGRVVEGLKVGRKIGFPTANIEANEVTKLIPGYGVYAVKIRIDHTFYKGMLNIGSRPTFNQNADNRSIEVNVFDFEGSLYGKDISLLFIDKIRDERKFSGIDALIEQLHLDKVAALKILAGDETAGII